MPRTSVYVFFLAPYPSGKGEVCKTFMNRFDSDRRLNKKDQPPGWSFLFRLGLKNDYIKI